MTDNPKAGFLDLNLGCGCEVCMASAIVQMVALLTEMRGETATPDYVANALLIAASGAAGVRGQDAAGFARSAEASFEMVNRATEPGARMH